jgi:IS5 family transposase
VQPNAIAHPTDARLALKAIEKPVGFAKRHDVALRQRYLRVAKRAAIMVGRYMHAHQFKRTNRELKFLRTRLGRLIRDINRKIAGNPALAERFAPLRALAVKVRFQNQRQRRPKVYSLHAPEVECIGKGKARAPYEFGCKVSIAVPVTQPEGGQFVVHAKALHGNPFDGHTLKTAVADAESNTGVEVRRIHVDKGYRGHDYPNRFRVFISGQVRRAAAAIKREMKRRAAVEPVIGHVKADHCMDPNDLKGRDGDRINAVLAAAGFNFHLLLRWLAALLRHFPCGHPIARPAATSLTLQLRRNFTGDSRWLCHVALGLRWCRQQSSHSDDESQLRRVAHCHTRQDKTFNAISRPATRSVSSETKRSGRGKPQRQHEPEL